MERWKVNLVVLWFGQFFVLSGMTMIIPFLPLYLQEIGIKDPSKVALWSEIIFAGNFVTSFIFQPLWGRIADRYGRKIMLLRSGFGMAAVITLMGFSTSAWQLLILRLLNGTISGFIPAGIALMSSNTPKEKMGFALGTLQSGAVAGTILGPLIGGLLASWFSFRPIFYITGSLLFIATLLIIFFVTEQFDKKEASSQPPLSTYQGFLQLSKIRQLPSLFSITFIIQFAMLSSMPLLPLFVQQLHGKGEMLAFYAGLVGSITGFSNMIASPILGRWSDKSGAERTLIISLLGAAITFIPQAFVQNIWQLFAARFLFGFFIGGLLPSVNALIRKHTPDGMESRAYSFNTSAMGLGNMTGPIFGGLIYDWFNIRGIFIFSSFLLVINAVWVRFSLHSKNQQSQND